MGIDPATDDNVLIARIVEHNRRMLPHAVDGQPRGRAQHRKHHGCVRAVFTVADDIPSDLRHGVFAEPKSCFAALVRFSNGQTHDDSEPDAHGMAIKLLDITGDRLPRQDWQTSQDFVLVDDELFFSGELAEYEAINRAIAEGSTSLMAQHLPKALTKLLVGIKLKMATQLQGVPESANQDERNLVAALRDFAGQAPASPLASHYWSTTPYRLGDQVVKYMAIMYLANLTDIGYIWIKEIADVDPEQALLP